MNKGVPHVPPFHGTKFHQIYFPTNFSLGSMVLWNPTCINQTSINKISRTSVVPLNAKIDIECATEWYIMVEIDEQQRQQWWWCRCSCKELHKHGLKQAVEPFIQKSLMSWMFKSVKFLFHYSTIRCHCCCCRRCHHRCRRRRCCRRRCCCRCFCHGLTTIVIVVIVFSSRLQVGLLPMSKTSFCCSH